MCDPVTAITVASAGLGIASSVKSYSDGKKNAKADRQAALAEYEGNMRSLNDRGQQELEASAEQKLAQQREYRAAKASAVVAAEDAGIMGNSVDGLLNDLAMQQADRNNAVDTNIDWTIRQLRSEQQGAANTMTSRMNAARNPSLGALLINVGGQALNGYTTYKGRTDPNWAKK